MQSSENQQRVKSIYRMLLEMATGNLAFRLSLHGTDKHFNELATDLNFIAEKMQKCGFNNPNASTVNCSNSSGTTEFVEKVQDYILNHLAEPLPTTKELSKMFGTNEFTLKENFRNLLKTSIYQFYNNERLKRAHFLIQQTALPLNEIATICGFNDYPNFYKAFKKGTAIHPELFLEEQEIQYNIRNYILLLHSIIPE